VNRGIANLESNVDRSAGCRDSQTDPVEITKETFMNKHKLILLAAACVTVAAAPLVSGNEHAFIWSKDTGMVDLGTLGGSTSEAFGINDQGQVVGWSYLGDETEHAFIWSAATGMVDLGPIPHGLFSFGLAINSSGNIVGEGLDYLGRNLPFYWSRETGYILPAERYRDSITQVFGINDSGDVAGVRYEGAVAAFVWQPLTHRYHELGFLPGSQYAVGQAINNRQHVTGAAGLADLHSVHAFIWEEGKGLCDIGAIPGGEDYTRGLAINDNDEIAGFGIVGTTGPYEAFYWSSTTGILLLQTLGGAQSLSFSINRGGEIAGFSTIPGEVFHAALWPDHASAPIDLGTLRGGTNSYGQGVNNLGQVAGYSDVR
jgi:probable HAF family extracellular repeat protein